MTGAVRMLAGVMLLPIVAGCFGIGRTQVEPASVDLDRLIVRSTNSAGASVELVLRVHNPNRIELRGSYVRLMVTADGIDLGEVQADEPFTLPPRATTDLVLPFRVDLAGTGTARRAALGAERVRYALSGRLGVEAGGSRLSLPVAREGTVPVLGPGS